MPQRRYIMSVCKAAARTVVERSVHRASGALEESRGPRIAVSVFGNDGKAVRRNLAIRTLLTLRPFRSASRDTSVRSPLDMSVRKLL